MTKKRKPEAKAKTDALLERTQGLLVRAMARIEELEARRCETCCNHIYLDYPKPEKGCVHMDRRCAQNGFRAWTPKLPGD